MISTKMLFISLVLGVLFGLVTMFSNVGQWGIFSSVYGTPYLLKFIFGFIYGIVAVAILSKLDWMIVPGGAVLFGLFAASIFQFQSNLFIKAFELGIFLMVFDWIFENLGARFGYWYSKKSSFFVKAVPIEVMIGAVSGGFGWALFMPRIFDLFYILLISLIAGIGGAFGENMLGKIGNMKYGNGWTWMHAVVSYFLVWIFLSLVWYFIII